MTGEFQILLDQAPPITRDPRLRVEYGESVEADDLDKLKTRLTRRIRDVLVFTPDIELVPSGTLPRTERKARRLFRLYKGENP
ncbi:MAG: hypothetical protein HY260_03085 [Chloroflexi bacterium]|nr:hypothetical protein [Chloroflexota bacterium]